MLATVLAGPASAQNPPPAATPGGALPELPKSEAAPPPGSNMFPIPPVIERPLDEQEGERLFVKKFVLSGAAPHPKLGIDIDELNRLVEDLRVERQGLNQVDETGFTDEEKAQITEFMSRVVASADLDMNFQEYEALIDKLRAEKAQRDAGMTIVQMQRIADAVTEYYRSAGFILAQAYIPAQEVSGGKVKIQVQEGTLGNVLAEGNKRYSDEVLAQPFSDLIDAPVTAGAVESAVLLAADNPGLTVFGVFQPGRDVGTSDLVLRVQDEKPYSATVRYDNFGTSFTGERRVYGDFTWNSPTGVGDRLTGTLLRQYMPKRSLFGQVAYERPFFDQGLTFGGSFQRNPFSVGGTAKASKLSGSSTVAEGHVRKTLIRSRAQSLYGRVDLKTSVARTKQNRSLIAVDYLTSAGLTFDYDSIDSEARAINVASLETRMGLGDRLGGHGKAAASAQSVPPSRRVNSGKYANNNFTKVAASYSRLQTLAENQSVLLRADAQWSPSLLTSLEQFSVGGPNSVRAYKVSERLADSGMFLSAEYTVSAPGFADVPAFSGLNWGQVLRLSFFTDYSVSWLNNPTTTEVGRMWLAGAGAGVSFNIPGQLTSRIQWAHPLGRRVPGDVTDSSPGSSDRDKGLWWFDFTYQF